MLNIKIKYKMKDRWKVDCLPKHTDSYIVTMSIASQYGAYREVGTLRYEIFKGQGRWIYPASSHTMGDYPYDVVAWMELPSIYE